MGIGIFEDVGIFMLPSNHQLTSKQIVSKRLFKNVGIR